MASIRLSKSTIKNNLTKYNSVSDISAIPASTIPIEVLIVAGGGAGGGAIGGGAGAGGLLYYGSETPKTPNGPAISIPIGSTYSVQVGGGGSAGAQFNFEGTEGTNSSFGTYIAYAGVCQNRTGGSGGGAGHDGSNPPGAGRPGQGNSGSWYSLRGAPNYPAGGGGGAGTKGFIPASLSSPGGAGGTGLQYSISGTATYYAGGGGGGTWNGNGNTRDGASFGAGGLGGGGGTPGSTGSGTYNASINTGGGGAATGAGGSGIVIVRHSNTYSQRSVTGSPTITNTGGYIIYKFTGNGSITF